MVLKQIIIDEFNALISKLNNDVSVLKAKKEDKENAKKEITAINFKIRNFVKVVSSLNSYSENEITSSTQVKELPGIGKGTMARIDEILANGKLAESHQEIKNDDLNVAKIIDDLCSVSGIGPSKASELNGMGITLEKLLNEYEIYKTNKDNKDTKDTKDTKDNSIINSLTHHQIIGLKYYHQFQKRIPRSTIQTIELNLKSLLNKYLKTKSIKDENKVELVICGSYRRGNKDSGDIDILITNDTDIEFDLIDFVKYLTDKNFITDHLTEKGTTKFMGVCDQGYRIDIRHIPKESYGAALMYFTGSKTFNTLVRTEALKLGYTLEEYGLYPLQNNKQNNEKEIQKDIIEQVIDENPTNNLNNLNTKMTKAKWIPRKKMANSHQHMKGEKIECQTEEIIFEFLKIDKKYLNPINRNIDDNIGHL